MKRVVTLAALSLAAVLAVAAPALAEYPPKPGNHPTASVAPKLITKSPTSGIAFTGANIAAAVLIALALAVVGMALLWAARRIGRQAPTPGSS